jgi:hypothetical protein
MKRIAVWVFYGIGALAIVYLALYAYAAFTGRGLQPGDPIHIFRKPDAPDYSAATRQRFRLMTRNEGAAHGDVLLGPDLRIVVSPTLPGIVEEADPEQIELGSIVDQHVSIPVSLRRDDGKWRIELQDGHRRLSDRVGEFPV